MLDEQNTEQLPVPVEPQRASLLQMAKWGVGTAAPVELISLAAHGGWAGLAIAGALGFVAARHAPQGLDYIHHHLELPGLFEQAMVKRDSLRSKSGRTWQERLAGLPANPERLQREKEATQTVESTVSVMPEPERAEEDDIFLSQREQVQPLPCERVTVEQIVSHSASLRNSYRFYIGRSLKKPGNPVCIIGFHKRHMKFIGASQQGKSTMVACALDIIKQTHDPAYVQFAIFDLEDRTGNLFNDSPHVLRVRKDGQIIPLHARSEEQVLEYLGYLWALVVYRYRLPLDVLDQQPLVIAYIEEFIALKDYFKRKAESGGEQDQQDFNTLISLIKLLAARALKAKVQLWLCTQADYRDPDLQESLVNVTEGFAFCLRESAARAAGFNKGILLTENYSDNRKGQCVVETAEVKDLILAPEYDLEAKLRAIQAKPKTEFLVVDLPTSSVKASAPSSQEEEALSPPNLLEQALEKYDQGYRTIHALANALGMTPWTVRDVYAQVKMQRPNMQEVSS